VVQTTIADLADKGCRRLDVYLRLHLLSHRLVAPHGLSADGFFGLLTNVGVDQLRPVRVEGSSCAARCAPRGPVTVGIDKFPRMSTTWCRRGAHRRCRPGAPGPTWRREPR